MDAAYQQFLPVFFPRLLGVAYLVAFASLLPQVTGLFGARGILPINLYLAEYRAALGQRAFRLCPSLFWLTSSDRALTLFAATGVILSLALIAGASPVPLLILLWLLYLSYVSVGQEFLSYQWDSLLLEAGFMTIFLPIAAPASPLAVFTYRFFLFRFIVSSGAVKVFSGDPTWRNLTALTYHYQTQPLPNRVAWYAHQLPEPAQKLSTLATLICEIAVPFLAFGAGAARTVCFAAMILLQLLIFSTGSFGFFNILTVILCVPLLDDRIIGSYLTLPASVPDPFLRIALDIVFALFLALNIWQLIALFYRPYWLKRLLGFISPFMISNHYGLFAVMTTDRLEYEIEGSNDTVRWEAYDFRYKPGKVDRPPRQAAPHQPRLDWQMWFAALQPTDLEPWLQSMVVRLLEGVPEVLRLLSHNPFPDHPPKYLRITIYRYRFTTFEERRKDGRWWDRTLVGRFKPMMLKEEGAQRRKG